MAALDDLRMLCAEISDLGRARALLAWDERTQMPPGGARIRSEQLATLTRLRHKRLASDELGRLLDATRLEVEGLETDSFEASLVRVTAREWEKARRVPVELRGEIARVASVAERAWEAARGASDFGAFLPHLERVVDLKRRYIECFDFDHPYDPLLDDFEPGMKTAEVRPLLNRLRDGLHPLVASIGERDGAVDDSCLHGDFPLEAQRRLASRVLAGLPLADDSWRLDPAVHPFATGIAISDLRITTRFDPAYIGAALWAVIHEGGHAIYQSGIDPRLERTPLCRSASLGFDESQSRMWENWIGRGRGYLALIRPLLAELFPERFAGITDSALYRAANRARPTLIRMEADEVTYNLHIALRFELELWIFERRLELAELPEAWNELTRDYLGLEVPDAARGVLQDVHWAAGSFGYFPTYALGNVIAGQLWVTMDADLGDLSERIAAGELSVLRDWLSERVHRHGGKLLPAELIERACGGSLDPEPLLRQLREKFAEIYGIELNGSEPSTLL
jgi:carboxypeptidase Taq